MQFPKKSATIGGRKHIDGKRTRTTHKVGKHENSPEEEMLPDQLVGRKRLNDRIVKNDLFVSFALKKYTKDDEKNPEIIPFIYPLRSGGRTGDDYIDYTNRKGLGGAKYTYSGPQALYPMLLHGCFVIDGKVFECVENRDDFLSYIDPRTRKNHLQLRALCKALYITCKTDSTRLPFCMNILNTFVKTWMTKPEKIRIISEHHCAFKPGGGLSFLQSANYSAISRKICNMRRLRDYLIFRLRLMLPEDLRNVDLFRYVAGDNLLAKAVNVKQQRPNNIDVLYNAKLHEFKVGPIMLRLINLLLDMFSIARENAAKHNSQRTTQNEMRSKNIQKERDTKSAPSFDEDQDYEYVADQQEKPRRVRPTVPSAGVVLGTAFKSETSVWQRRAEHISLVRALQILSRRLMDDVDYSANGNESLNGPNGEYTGTDGLGNMSCKRYHCDCDTLFRSKASIRVNGKASSLVNVPYSTESLITGDSNNQLNGNNGEYTNSDDVNENKPRKVWDGVNAGIPRETARQIKNAMSVAARLEEVKTQEADEKKETKDQNSQKPEPKPTPRYHELDYDQMGFETVYENRTYVITLALKCDVPVEIDERQRDMVDDKPIYRGQYAVVTMREKYADYSMYNDTDLDYAKVVRFSSHELMEDYKIKIKNEKLSINFEAKAGYPHLRAFIELFKLINPFICLMSWRYLEEWRSYFNDDRAMIKHTTELQEDCVGKMCSVKYTFDHASYLKEPNFYAWYYVLPFMLPHLIVYTKFFVTFIFRLYDKVESFLERWDSYTSMLMNQRQNIKTKDLIIHEKYQFLEVKRFTVNMSRICESLVRWNGDEKACIRNTIHRMNSHNTTTMLIKEEMLCDDQLYVMLYYKSKAAKLDALNC